MTNPPFGQSLKVSASDCKRSHYTISLAAGSVGKKRAAHVDLEIGLVYLELAHRLLQVGGRVGIVLPENILLAQL